MAARAVPVVTSWHSNPPFGMTFFGHPTGRYGDGRGTIDFIAEEFGLPLLPASLNNSSSIRQGVNFAVGGATVTDVDFFERNNLVPFKLLNCSLNVQLGWFEQLRPQICDNTSLQGYRDYDCFSRSLFFFGEIGVNDYSLLWLAGKTKKEVKAFVPTVVKKIAIGVERLIKEGVVYIVVPGNPPNGCSPTMLILLANKTDYDHIGCLRDLNSVAVYHNTILRVAIGSLRDKHPQARIIFADFYNPIVEIFKNPTHFVAHPLRTCCGGGGRYNYNVSAICGMPGVTACKDPEAYVSWDGVHYTEATNRYIAEGWLHGPYADPPILSVVRS
ncbi:unnamed protein product [Alopecurus aequalis]